MIKFIIAFCIVPLLAACAAPNGTTSSTATSGAPVSCAGDTGSPMRIFELYFGRAVKGRRDVTDQEWNEFRDKVITANLPEGYTVLDGTGAWLNPDTHLTKTEHMKLLIAAEPDTPASLAAIQRVRVAYETTYNQKSVGVTTHSGCGNFSD
jgi:hypothetical protein